MDAQRPRRDNDYMSNANNAPSPEYFSANPDFPNAHVYTPAVAFAGLVFLAAKSSGAAPDPTDVKGCAQFVLDEVERELIHAGSSMDKVLKVTVYLRSMDDWGTVNEAYIGRFGANPPARTTIAATLPRNSLVGIDVIAYR